MPGLGPAPKDPSRRARRNVDVHPTTTLPFQSCNAPELPKTVDWHPQTRRWWSTWQDSPMAELMGPTDWDFLLDTALMHNALWSGGHWTVAAELRLRVAKFGATPEDRLRLRISWADADAKDGSRPQAAAVPDRASSRYAKLRAVPTPTAED